MEQAIEIISTLGFPMFVALFYMLITNKTQKEMTTSMNELKTVVTKLHERLDG